MMWEMLFWFSLAAIFYHYCGYPLVLLFLHRVLKRPPVQAADITPTVSLIISAYNEEDVIRKKVENALALDYPADKLEIIVASDGSTDATCDIVREYAPRGVILHHNPDRRGKNGALNSVAPHVRGEILVFTDANGMFQANAIRELVRPFADARVGCVCGELIYRNPNENLVAEGYNHYWRYDQWLKKLETRLLSLLGANGSIFAVRRELNEWLDPRISNDMVLPIKIAGRGHAVLYQPKAVSVESGSAGEHEELRRRSRIVARGVMGALFLIPELLRHGSILTLLQLFSRKVLRYVFPLLLLTLLVSNCFLSGTFYRLTLAGQVVPYALALVGYYLNQRGIKIRLLSLPYYFCVGNLAALKGLFKVVSLQELATWEGFDRRYDLALGETAGGRRRD
jgi:cellulose synthase/poly-beta-1,6-N-acetylglucosamine synthase-like glycosyltransferase